jgi:hypothetical protein
MVKRTHKKGKTRKSIRKNRYMNRVRSLRKRMSLNQNGGGFSFESVSKDNEKDAVVTAFPDPSEPEQAPMTARLPLIRRVLADTAV